jgi:hypothetical protein
MAFSRDFYDRLAEAYASLVSEEMIIVVELDDGPNLTELVRGEIDGLSWRAGTVRFKVPKDTKDTFVIRWTLYNADWVPVFEGAVNNVFVSGGTELRLDDLRHFIDLPVTPTRLDHEQQLINGL